MTGCDIGVCVCVCVCARPYAGIFSEGQEYLQYSRENANEARSTRAGEGVGAFAFLRLKLNDLVHTLGGFFWGKINLKK